MFTRYRKIIDLAKDHEIFIIKATLIKTRFMCSAGEAKVKKYFVDMSRPMYRGLRVALKITQNKDNLIVL